MTEYVALIAAREKARRDTFGAMVRIQQHLAKELAALVPDMMTRDTIKFKFKGDQPSSIVKSMHIADYIWDIRDGQACDCRDQT